MDLNIAIPFYVCSIAIRKLHFVQLFEDWSSNLGDYEDRNSNFGAIWQNLTYRAKYLRTCWIDLHNFLELVDKFM